MIIDDIYKVDAGGAIADLQERIRFHDSCKTTSRSIWRFRLELFPMTG